MTRADCCHHCGERVGEGEIIDNEDAGLGRICDECAELAVMGEPCASCGDLPSDRPCAGLRAA